MQPPRYKNVKPEDIKPGDHLKGYEEIISDDHTCMHLCDVTVQDDGTPLVYNKYPITEKVSYFYKPLSWQEMKDWYKNAVDMSLSVNQLNLIGLHTDLYGIGDACHEMWNGWIQTTWEEQLVTLVDENFIIVGIADPAPPRSCYSMRHPVAVIIEYKDGDRYWCHAEKDWIDDMREDSLEIYKSLEASL